MKGLSLTQPWASLVACGLKRIELSQQSGGAPRATGEPLPTVATDGAIGLCEPFIVQITHEGRLHDINRPLPTITGGQRGDLAVYEPFLVEYHGERDGEAPRVRSVEDPLPTQTTENRFGLAQPFVVALRGLEDSHLAASARSLDDPLRTISAAGTHHALVEPFTLPYCSNGGQLARSVSEPVGTITTRDRFALVIPEGLDIRFRMLQPHELAAAMGFPADYRFLGTKGDVIRMIGNAWSCRVAEALCACALAEWAESAAWQREATA